MEWYDDYNIGVELIDAQHQELFKVVNRLQKALAAGRAHDELADTLRFLVRYTQQHFHDEEEVMADIGFEELARHKKLHANLIEDIKNILVDLKKGKTIHPYALIDFLTDWLMNHIRYEDNKIGRAVRLARHERNWTGNFD